MQNRELAAYLLGMASAATLALVGAGIIQGGRYLVAALFAFLLGLLLKWPFGPVVWPAFSVVRGQEEKRYEDAREMAIRLRGPMRGILVVADNEITAAEVTHEAVGDSSKFQWLIAERAGDNRIVFWPDHHRRGVLPAGTVLELLVRCEKGENLRLLAVQPSKWSSWLSLQARRLFASGGVGDE